MRYCKKCKKFRKIIRFERDNPILSCNHSEIVENNIKDDIESYMIQEAIQKSKPLIDIKENRIKDVLQFLDDCEEKPTVGKCKICGTVTIYHDRKGIARCGGDMVKNPGCGMPIISMCKV